MPKKSQREGIIKLNVDISERETKIACIESMEQNWFCKLSCVSFLSLYLVIFWVSGLDCQHKACIFVQSEKKFGLYNLCCLVIKQGTAIKSFSVQLLRKKNIHDLLVINYESPYVLPLFLLSLWSYRNAVSQFYS